MWRSRRRGQGQTKLTAAIYAEAGNMELINLHAGNHEALVGDGDELMLVDEDDELMD